MTEYVGTLDEVVLHILKTHVPDEDADHWANERKCRGCDRYIHLIIEGFERHQAKVISDMVRDRLACR